MLAQLITARGYGRIQANAQLAEVWKAAVGTALATYTRPFRLRRGVLEISVSNSTVIQELNFEKQRILADLQARSANLGIRDLRFRIGDVK